MKNITAVIYHKADFDGLCSRAVAERYFNGSADYIGWDYNDPIPNLDAYSVVYVIDIRLTKEAMDANAEKIIWIDHHKSSIESITKNIAGIRIDGVAACRLAYQWFFGNQKATKEEYVNRLVTEPTAVRLLGEFDVWDKRDSNTDIFQVGAAAEKALDWKRLLDDVDNGYIARIIGRGQAIWDYLEVINKQISNERGFDIRFHGLNFRALNIARCNSITFKDSLQENHDGCLAYFFDGKIWKFSLYGVPGKPDVDLSAIAVQYGGGGHKQACGFTLDKLPAELGGL